MQKMICIPEERYYLMLETYDRVMEELEEVKKALHEAQKNRTREGELQ